MRALEPPTDEVMDYRGLSLYLKMAEGTLRHLVMRGEIPFFKIGRSVRFAKKHIDLWLEKKRRRAGAVEKMTPEETAKEADHDGD